MPKPIGNPLGDPSPPAPSSPATLTESPDVHAHPADLEWSDQVAMTSLVPPRYTASTDRYVLTAFHARGGMGEVWRCQDSSIGREVALKRLVVDVAAARERFLCEAQVTGQLEHPGIVPIHDVGVDDDGQPFYVMKLVRGRTLKAVIDDFHNPVHSNDRPAEPRDLQRVRLLKILIDLCHAVGYAHSRGVVHRDLKPDNVMLGAFGETVVLDWGLAKVSGQADDSPPAPQPGVSSGVSSGRPTVSPGNSTQTLDGSILGSPLYMPPEMAEGRHADVDPRTDVYLLGATLYEILTGQPPRQGKSREELLELARTAPPVHPRKIVSDTPAALAAICLKAMSRSQPRRYESAMAMATDVQRFLADEPVSAYPQRWPARAWRWAKRHRRTIARSAIAASFIVTVAVAALLYRQSTSARARERARVQVEHIRQLTDQARFYAANVDSPGELMPYYQPARGQELAREAVTMAGRWGAHLDQLPLVEWRDPLRRDLGDLSLQMERMSSGEPSAFWQARARDFAVDSTSDAAATARGRFLDAEQARSSSDASGIPLLDDAETKQRRVRSLLHAVDGFQAAIALDPAHYWSHLQLGRCYLALGRGPQAAEVLGGCIAMRPDAPWGYTVRGLAFSLMRRFDEAQRDLDRALVLDPQCLAAHLNRGVMYRLAGHPEKAAAEFDALLSQPRPPVEAAIYRSRLYLDAANFDQALACFDREPVNVTALATVAYLKAEIHLARGDTQACLQQLDGIAPTAAQRGHLLRVIASEVPQDQQRTALELALQDLNRAAESPGARAATLSDLGAVLQLLGRKEQALAAYSRAVTVAPDEPQTLVNRGWCYESLDRLDDARADFSRAIQVAPDHAEAMTGLGYIEARLGHGTEAQRQASLAILHGGGDYLILHNVACIYARLSTSDSAHADEHQNTAIELLQRAVIEWRQGWHGRSEIELIRQELPNFPPSLRRRPEFKKLIDDANAQAPDSGLRSGQRSSEGRTRATPRDTFASSGSER